MKVTIRAAHPEDGKAISRLIREELDVPVSAADITHALANLCVNPRHRIFAASIDGVLVGFLHLCDYDSLLLHVPMKLVLSMAVGGSYRRVGIGTALLKRAERHAAESGAGGIRLDAPAQFDDGAKAFFAHCGYTAEPQTRYEKLFEDTKGGYENGLLIL